MKTNEISREEAIIRINGWIVEDCVVYYDDSTQRYYAGPVADCDALCELMNDSNPDVSRDAYSLWCAATSHGDGYETKDEAQRAAQRINPVRDYLSTIGRRGGSVKTAAKAAAARANGRKHRKPLANPPPTT